MMTHNGTAGYYLAGQNAPTLTLTSEKKSMPNYLYFNIHHEKCVAR